MKQMFWKNYPINEGQDPLHFNFKSLHVWIKKHEQEFWIAHEYATEDVTQPSLDDETLWNRWAPKKDEQEVRLRPVFPTLPVIVSSEYPLKLAPGAKIKVYSRIPAFLEISLPKSDYVMLELPITKLSRTWFGTTLEGELCYWLTSKTRRSLEMVESDPFLIQCPIQITNKSEAELIFDQFCYRVERLGVYLVDQYLWSDATNIVYQGEEQHSDITMTGKLPSEVGKGELLSKPRNPVSRSFATRTFKKLFDETIISAK